MVLTHTGHGRGRRLLLLAVLTTACASAGPGAAPARGPEPEPDPVDLVWPPPPAPPHLTWAGSFTVPKDLGLRTGMWRRARRALIGGPGDQLVRPQGIAIQGHTIYITDPATTRLLIYDQHAKKFQALPADADHPWQVPTGVAARATGQVAIADASGAIYMLPARDEPAARHLLCYGSANGAYLGAIGERGTGPGQFNFPTHLTVAPDGTLYVTDAMNFRVQHLAPDGTPLAAFGKPGDGTGYFAKPKGVALDSRGTIYVVDAMHDVVQLFDEQGQFLMHVGGPGHRPGEFWLPTGIAIDTEDRVYIADSYNRRVQILAPVTQEEPQ